MNKKRRTIYGEQDISKYDGLLVGFIPGDHGERKYIFA